MERQEPPGTVWRMANRLLEGRLAERIAEHRGAGLSWDEIARRLYDEGGIEVTSETLRKWAKHLGVEGEAA